MTTLSPTEVVVQVQADPDVRAAMRELRVEVWAGRDGQEECGHPSCWSRRFERDFPAAGQPWPVTFPVLPSDDDSRVFEVIVQALGKGKQVLVETRAVSHFVPGHSTTVSLALTVACAEREEACGPVGSACHGASCQVCRDGACQWTGVFEPLRGDLHLVLAEGGLDAGPDAGDAQRDGDGQPGDASTGDAADSGDADAVDAAHGGDAESGADAAMSSACDAESWDHDADPLTPCKMRTVCAPGEYVTEAGDAARDRTCGGCASGTYTVSENEETCVEWTVCEPGTYVKSAGSASADRVCEACEEGTSSMGSNQGACLRPEDCQAGTVQVSAATSAAPAVCQACDVGTYCKGGAAKAAACAGDTWDHDADPATACAARTVCGAGKYVSGEGDAATDRTCTSCASGAFSRLPNVSSCTPWRDCTAGRYVTNTPSAIEDRACGTCAANTYTNAANLANCVPVGRCVPGEVQTKAATRTSPASCEACMPGSYCAGDTAPAVACAGTLWDHDGDPSTPCTERTSCVAGKYVANPGSATADRTCTNCTSGSYSTQDNADKCQAWSTCSAGTYVTGSPSATQDRSCSPCVSGTFTDASNQSMCLPVGSCRAGTVETRAGTATSPPVCSPCEAGTYCAGNTAAAAACSATTWDHDGDPSTKCVARTSCVAGKYVANAGNAVKDRTCAACDNGSFSTQDNAETCDLWSTCEAGTYVTSTPSSTQDRTCAKCAKGTFTTSDNQTMCLVADVCEAGTTQTKAATATAPAVCEACSKGTYCAGDTAPPVGCDSSTWDHDADASTLCVARTNCVAGEYVADAGGALKDRVCAACANGTFSTQDNASECEAWTPCKAGSEESVPGTATADRQCAEASWTGTYEPGFVQFLAGTIQGGVYLAGEDFLQRFDRTGAKGWSWRPEGAEVLRALATDSDGNAYLVVDTSLRKYDSSGTMVWESPVQGSQRAIDLYVDGSRNVYVQLLPGEGGRYTLSKHDSAGDHDWSVNFGAAQSAGNDPPLAMRVDASGNVILAEGLYGERTVQVRTLGSGGDEELSLHTVTVSEPLYRGASLDVDAAGNLYVFGQVPIAPGGDRSAGTVSAFGADGTLRWERSIDSFFNNAIAAIAVATDGRVYVSVFGLTGAVEDDEAFVLQYEKDGTAGWVQSLGVVWRSGALIEPLAGRRAYAASPARGASTTSFVTKLVP